MYRTLHRLIERELVETTPLNKKQCVYHPLTLAALIRALERDQKKMRKLELSLRDIDHLLPFADLTSEDEEEVAEVITGKDAFHNEYLQLVDKQNDEFLAIGSSDGFWQASQASVDSPLERSFVSRRLKNNIYSRVLMVASEEADKIAEKDSKEKRTSKLKKELPVMKDMLMICGDQVSHFVCDTKNPRVLKVRDPQFVNMQRWCFETLWKS